MIWSTDQRERERETKHAKKMTKYCLCIYFQPLSLQVDLGPYCLDKSESLLTLHLVQRLIQRSKIVFPQALSDHYCTHQSKLDAWSQIHE